MNAQEALQRTREIIRRKHLALSTEEVYCAWLRRYCQFVKTFPPHIPSVQKLEAFLTNLANENVAASTQNQAFNAILFFYTEVLRIQLGNIHALPAKRPEESSSLRFRPRFAKRTTLAGHLTCGGLVGLPFALANVLLSGNYLQVLGTPPKLSRSSRSADDNGREKTSARNAFTY